VHWEKSNQNILGHSSLVVLLLSRTPDQGDQIRRIVAYWGIVFFGQFFFIYRRSFQFLAHFFQGENNVFILTKNGLGCILGDFRKLIWSP
jgi:hypothetical protein